MPLSTFHPVVQAWFEETFGQPTPPQREGWPAIARGENCLILAPTGSGKTLAAFLKCLDHLYQQSDGLKPGVQVLYISPLKALNNDIHRNLEVPLQGIEAKAVEMGVALPRITKAVRTGDTPARDRAAMVRRPPHVLITTPESLYLLLTSRAREMLRTVRYVIIDEIHAVCGQKRGVHLSLSLERLTALLPQAPVRIGLSATQRPLEEIARYLGGVDRPVRIIDTGTRKNLDLKVEVPLEDMRALPDNTMWKAIEPRLVELIQQHRSTLIFVNYRGLAERLADHLNRLAGKELARVHHGSMSRESRETIEQDLKAGRLPCLVATASLELGIDIGAIDLVIQVESPKSAARGLQRVGRAGHIVGATAKGRMLPKHRGDLLEMACISRAMLRGEVEETHVPTGALDVLAQQLVAMAAMEEWKVDDLFSLIRRSYCYRDLSRRQLESLLEMLSGRYPAEEFRELRPRIVWDRATDVVRGRDGSRALAILSGGTIPDRGYFGVYIGGTDVKLGEMDEEFVYEARVGEVFLLGTSTWRIEAIEANRLVVSDAAGATPKMPFWKGDGLGRPFAMGLKLGAFTRELTSRLDNPDLRTWLRHECALDVLASRNLLTYLEEQREAVGVLPSDRQVVIESYTDELGDTRLAILSPFGSRVHLAWMVIIRRRIRELLGLEAEMSQTDDGIMIRLPGSDAELPLDQLLRVDLAWAEEALLSEIGETPVFGAHFRMNAGRALILPRPRPGKRQPFWLQRLRAADLLQVARKYESFPIVLETYREVLHDVLDVDGLRAVLRGIQAGEIGVEAVETATPSPFAASLLMQFVGSYMYEGEAPKAERRATLLNINRDLLREILGGEQLRSLLDRRAIAAVDARMQRLAPDWQPRNVDEAEDLLRQLGDLSEAELADRGVGADWLDALMAQGRVSQVMVGGEARYAVTEDSAVYGDLSANADAIVRRYALNRGPFQAGALAARYGFAAGTVENCLAALIADGALAAGEYTPGVTGREYCAVEALQQIHRQTLSLLRREIEPVDGAAFARFLAGWQGIGGSAGTGDASDGAQQRLARIGGPPATLRRALAKLQAVPLPAESWEQDILPARVPGYQPIWLDQLCATGELHWAAAPGGKVAFYLPESLPVLGARLQAATADGSGPELSAEDRQALDALSQTGADFVGGIARAAGLAASAAQAALERLMWLGLVTNDTFAPVRASLTKRGGARSSTGRWSLTAKLAPGDAGAAQLYARLLLQRYGVVSREVAQAEDCPLPWPDVLSSLKEMELRGQIRRGYFIAGISGAQFALPEAVERLRAARGEAGEAMSLLPACDPANPYGGILPYPGDARVVRVPSTLVVLAGGLPVLAVEAFGKRLTPLSELPDAQLRRALGCLKGMLATSRAPRRPRRIAVETWNGEPVTQSPIAPLLQELGFQREPTKYVLYR